MKTRENRCCQVVIQIAISQSKFRIFWSAVSPKLIGWLSLTVRFLTERNWKELKAFSWVIVIRCAQACQNLSKVLIRAAKPPDRLCFVKNKLEWMIEAKEKGFNLFFYCFILLSQSNCKIHWSAIYLIISCLAVLNCAVKLKFKKDWYL